MKQDFTIWRNQILQNPWDISPLKFGMSQDEIMEVFGKPDAVSTMRSGGKPLILKYCDIELHFDRKAPHGLYLVYSDDEIELSITAEHEETLQPITNTEPVDNEFSFKMERSISPAYMKTVCSKVLRPKTFAAGITGANPLRPAFLAGFAFVEQIRHRFGC